MTDLELLIAMIRSVVDDNEERAVHARAARREQNRRTEVAVASVKAWACP
jgi:hypothetical protein